MRTGSLDALFPRIRQEILAATLLHPDRWWFMADLARHLHVRPSSLQRELPALVASGILRDRREGRLVYYQPNPDCPILPDLQGLLLKTVGLTEVLQRALEPLRERIQVAFVHGSIARGDAVATSDVDFLVIGTVPLATLSPALAEAETSLARDVNPTVYTPTEFAKRRKAGHHFLKAVLSGPKLFILGGADDLDRLGREPAHPATQDKPRRARRAARSRGSGPSRR
jgi:predicted nucleotidyltransferase